MKCFELLHHDNHPIGRSLLESDPYLKYNKFTFLIKMFKSGSYRFIDNPNNLILRFNYSNQF